jgi:predicted metalloprotease with PDZ domain
MRYLYTHYYKELNRGFTEAEVQQVCEMIAGTSLAEEFEYIYTTKEMNYSKYLSYAGLDVSKKTDENGNKQFSIVQLMQPDALQGELLKLWLRE